MEQKNGIFNQNLAIFESYFFDEHKIPLCYCPVFIIIWNKKNENEFPLAQVNGEQWSFQGRGQVLQRQKSYFTRSGNS